MRLDLKITSEGDGEEAQSVKGLLCKREDLQILKSPAMKKLGACNPSIQKAETGGSQNFLPVSLAKSASSRSVRCHLDNDNGNGR